MICGSQLHKADIDGWYNFIFLNIEIDLCVLTAEAKEGIWPFHFKWK